MAQKIQRIGRECLGFRVRMLNRMISAIYDDALAGAGLKASQFNLLVAAVNSEQSRPADLAKALEMDESTVSRNVERLCAKGGGRRSAKPPDQGDRQRPQVDSQQLSGLAEGPGRG